MSYPQEFIDELSEDEEKLRAENRRLRRALWLARYERNLFLASVTHCQGSMNWKNEKLQAKLFHRAAKLLKASETCKAYAEKFE